jgi:hypothetical protein
MPDRLGGAEEMVRRDQHDRAEHGTAHTDSLSRR